MLDERESLLGASDTELRHRSVVPGSTGSEMDELLKAHHQAQEQVAEEMLGLTRALKEQTMAAGEIIRKVGWLKQVPV